jgi:hypothetical protein
MSIRRSLLPALLLFAGFTASACTAILVPDESEDGVERCNTSEDCDDTGDNRYIAQCVFGEDQPESSDKVCAADYEQINCGGEVYDGEHPLTIAFGEAVDAKGAYGQCADENRGERGCAPTPGVNGGCNDPDHGLNESGVCDDLDDPIPAVYPPDVGGIDIAGQDAKDQFCRWYFCDESFVCGKSGGADICQPCSGKDPADYGTGGCGQLYIQGERSPIYTDLDSANCEGDKNTDEAEFGPAPVVP